MDILHPLNDGDPVPGGTLVFRIARKAQLSPEAFRIGKASPEMFELTSEDKMSAGKRLSIWIEELTLPDQAWDFMGRKPANNVAACLSVDKVLAIPPQADFDPLRGEWEQALTVDSAGNKVRDTRPGSNGHAGIIGLNQGGDGRTHKNQRKEMRSDLADIASISPVPVPHDIPDEHLRVAAYFVYEKNTERVASEEANWIRAVRQLRRARVRDREVPSEVVANSSKNP